MPLQKFTVARDDSIYHAWPDVVQTDSGKLIIRIRDKGRGIEDIHTAMQPLYTTDTDGERSGMGFTVMQSFTDSVKVRSALGKGTVITLEKRLLR